MKLGLNCLCLSAILSLSPAAYGQETDQSQENYPYLIQMKVEGFFSNTDGTAIGTFKESVSGSIIRSEDKIYILSVAHMTRNVYVKRVDVFFADGRASTEAQFVGASDVFDVSLWKFKNKDFVYDGEVLEIDETSTLKSGEEITALGSPFGVDFGVNFCETKGTIIHPKFRPNKQCNNPDFILHSAIINSGNSGGPLLNKGGKLVGINFSVINGNIKSPFSSNMYAAVPASDILRLIPKMALNKSIKHGWIGGLTVDNSARVPKSEFDNLQVEQPRNNVPIITYVHPGGIADKAGLEIGDIVLEVAGEKILDYKDFMREIMHRAPMEMVDIKVLRDGAELTLAIELTEFPYQQPTFAK